MCSVDAVVCASFTQQAGLLAAGREAGVKNREIRIAPERWSPGVRSVRQRPDQFWKAGRAEDARRLRVGTCSPLFHAQRLLLRSLCLPSLSFVEAVPRRPRTLPAVSLAEDCAVRGHTSPPRYSQRFVASRQVHYRLESSQSLCAPACDCVCKKPAGWRCECAWKIAREGERPTCPLPPRPPT